MIDSSHKERSNDALVSSLQRFSDAGGSLIQIRTREPIRAATILREHFASASTPYHEWSASTGFRTFTTENFVNHATKGDETDFGTALARPVTELRNPTSELAAKSDRVHFFAFIDPAPHLANNPYALDLVQQYAAILPTSNAAILFITPDIPLDVLPAGTCLVTELPTPTVEELEEALRKMVGKVVDNRSSFPEGHSLTDEDMRRISLLGLGLTFSEFETHVALSIIEAAEAKSEALNIDHLIAGVSRGKTEVVKQSEILELIQPEEIGNVGGMQRLKDWIGQRANCYTEEAKEFGIESPKGLVLVGVPGCLTGDTIVDYKRGSRPSARPIRLDDLYRKFNGLPTSTRPWVDTTAPTFLHSLDPDGTVFYNRIVSVIDSGMKFVRTLRFSDGSSLTLTEDHPVCTPGGVFTPAGELEVGATVLARGSMKPVGQGGRVLDARPPRIIVNTKYHPYGSIKFVQEGEFFYEYKRVARARLVVEAHMNGMAYEEFVQVLNGNEAVATTLRYLEPIYEVHHVDENTLNDALSNLMVLHKVDHAREHGKSENFNVEYVKEVSVVSVEVHEHPAQTYDVQMDMPANNFVANGVIVHNTGKSLVAKAIASVLGIPLVRLDFGRVFSKYVGDSESRVRAALNMVEAMAPCVLFVDEIDKGLGGIGSGGDSGTSMRVLGSYLTWLQELQSPVFNMVTANRVNGLPPELLRRGRFDQIFSVTMPNENERRDVLAIHLRRRGRNIGMFKQAEVLAYLQASTGYVPAEIESAVKDALIMAYSRGSEFKMAHLLEALRDLVPLSKSHASQIAEIVEWAANNAIAVNYPGEKLDPSLVAPAATRRVIVPQTNRRGAK